MTSRAGNLLAQLADPARPVIEAGRVAVVVSHPDDETIGCGAVLPRLRDLHLVLVTDGAPRDLADAHRHGFDGIAAYAACRAAELDAALTVADVPAHAVARLGIGDQQACRTLVAMSRRLASLFSTLGIGTVLTHAYEGGHPDHDATAFAVHAAARSLGPAAPQIVEMPFYHLGQDGMVVQRFCDGREGLVLQLTPAERDCKRRMLACHATQVETLRPFETATERYRIAPRHDWMSLPNGGRVLYAAHAWGLAPDEWPVLARAALHELEVAACV